MQYPSTFCVYFLFLLQLLCARHAVFAQSANDTINPLKINVGLVQELFVKELNKVRGTAKLQPLVVDEILQRAASDQANYCRDQNKVTHFQDGNSIKYDVKKRVTFYKGNHYGVGENCLMTLLFQPIPDYKTKKNITVYTYAQLSHQMFEAWKSSPGHYRNMMDSKFTNTGLAVSVYGNKTVLYATQVFAGQQYFAPKNGLKYTDTTFGIGEREPGKCKTYGENEFLASIFSSYLIRYGDTIFQYYQTEKTIAELLSNKKDGLAIDMVYKNQFHCTEPHRLHPSTVFDGYLLPPKYRDDLFKNDRYSNDEFLTPLGIIPANAPREDLQLNVVMIQNGTACGYSYPVAIEEGILPNVQINPQWCKKSGKIKSGTAEFVREFEIPFAKSKQDADSFYFKKLKQVLSVYDGAIQKIEITAYSSIEGTEQRNLELQNNRAQFIRKYISENIRERTTVEINAAENWDLFYKQWKQDGSLPLFNDTTRAGIRTEVNKRMYEPLVDDWLNRQRVSTIRIFIRKEYCDSTQVQFMPLVLQDAIAKDDNEQAMIAYSRIIDAYEKGEVSKSHLSAIRVPLKAENLPLINNYLASILIESDIFNYQNFSLDYILYIDSARKMFPNFSPLVFNLCVYKMQSYFYGLINDANAFKKLETQILDFRNDTLISETVKNKLLYNYYLTGSIFYRQQRQYKDMYYSFESVKPYLSLANLSELEVADIARYFNYFFRFTETIGLLEKYLKKYPEEEELIYLYVSTGAIYNLNVDFHLDVYYKQMEKLAGINRARLCSWMNENYQLLRIGTLKQKLCTYCELK